MKHLGGLITASIASFIGGIAVIIFQYYWWPSIVPPVETYQVEVQSNFEVRLDRSAILEIAKWYVPDDEVQAAVRADSEVSVFAYRIVNKSKKDISDLNLEIHAADYKDDFSVIHAGITDPFLADVTVFGGGSDRWNHFGLKSAGATATGRIPLLKANEAIILVLVNNYSSNPEIDIRSSGVKIVRPDVEDPSEVDFSDDEIDLTWLIVLAFGIGGLLLGLGLSEQIHKTALNGIGFDYDELVTLVKQQNEKKSGE